MRILCFCLGLLFVSTIFAQDEPPVDEPALEEPSAEEPAGEDPEVQPVGPTTLKLKDRFYFGGWLGGSFGDVISSAEVAPLFAFISASTCP